MSCLKKLKCRPKLNEPLKGRTTFKIGGSAKAFIEPKDETDLKSLITCAKSDNIPILVIGSGSNLLIGSGLIKAIVLRLNKPYFKKIALKKNFLEAGAGAALAKLIAASAKSSLSGLEFLAGIPGTVGGALAMNAGAWGQDLGSLVESVRAMDYSGRIKTLKGPQLKFGYRESNLSKLIILSARFRLKKKDRQSIRENVLRNLALRRYSQDTSFPNAGCIFKNPQGESAGRLIDLCGLKGRKSGGAVISEKHANFILNRNNASAKDVMSLMKLIRKRVMKKFGIVLEPEIKIWQ